MTSLRLLSDKQRKQIVADYISHQNYSLVARMNGVTVDTVRRLMAKGDHVQELQQKREENTESVIEHMKNQSAMKNRILDKLLRGIEIKADDIDELNSIKELATAYGIIVDKELKILELQRGSGSIEGLEKVKELLNKIEGEAKNDTE